MTHFGENWDDNVFPLAYLITIRTHGTWLHGDERESVDVHGHYNIRGSAKRSPNAKLKAVMRENMTQSPFLLEAGPRAIVEAAIREVCEFRAYTLHAVNVRSNHAHAVVSASCMPEAVADSFKSYEHGHFAGKGSSMQDSGHGLGAGAGGICGKTRT